MRVLNTRRICLCNIGITSTIKVDVHIWLGHVRWYLTNAICKVDKNAFISMHNSGSLLPEELLRNFLNVLQSDAPAVDMMDLDHELIKKIMERHGGRIDIQNELTQGFTWQVYLPYP